MRSLGLLGRIEDAIEAPTQTTPPGSWSSPAQAVASRPARITLARVRSDWHPRPYKGREAQYRSRYLATANVYNCIKPTIAAVNGVAAGAGFSLALACDIRVASEAARFSAIFVKRAIVADTGCTWFLPRIVGQERALEMMYTGRMVGAEEAARIGLVSEVVPHERLAERVSELAGEIAHGPSLAVELNKRLAREAWRRTLEEQVELEEYLQAITHRSDDAKEGRASFLENATPCSGPLAHRWPGTPAGSGRVIPRRHRPYRRAAARQSVQPIDLRREEPHQRSAVSTGMPPYRKLSTSSSHWSSSARVQASRGPVPGCPCLGTGSMLAQLLHRLLVRDLAEPAYCSYPSFAGSARRPPAIMAKHTILRLGRVSQDDLPASASVSKHATFTTTVG
jgi:2-(1,2-epoxy-1,2-dihydrophenyl)acetyl-CoA isomerase